MFRSPCRRSSGISPRSIAPAARCRKMRRASRNALQSSSTMLGQLDASLAGVRVVKAAGAERHERRRYTRIMEGLVGEQLKMSRIDAMSAPILEMLTLLMVAAIVLYA